MSLYTRGNIGITSPYFAPVAAPIPQSEAQYTTTFVYFKPLPPTANTVAPAGNDATFSMKLQFRTDEGNINTTAWFRNQGSFRTRLKADGNGTNSTSHLCNLTTIHPANVFQYNSPTAGGTSPTHNTSKWFALATTTSLFDGVTNTYLIDMDSETVLSSLTGTLAVSAAGGLFTSTVTSNISTATTTGIELKMTGDAGADIAEFPFALGEVAVWKEVKSEAEILEFAKVGFASINSPTNLTYNYNFLLDWGGATVASEGSETLNMPVDGIYSLDNPVPIFSIKGTQAEHDSYGLNVLAVEAGTTYIAAYPAGTTAPTDVQIVAATGASDSLTFVHDGSGILPTALTGLVTGTGYDIYAVHDAGDLGTYSSISTISVTTPTKYSENILDVAGASVGAQTGIQWAWFDSVNPETLGSPSAQGTAEVTDATGLLEVTLPTTILTAKGAQGTMVLKSNWNAEVQSASHIVTVK